MMTGIAVCAVSLAVLREVALFAILIIGPLIGSLREVRKGGKGLIGGLIGGAITWGGFCLYCLIETYCMRRPPLTIRDNLILAPVIFALMILGGASLGLVVGFFVWYLRYLAALPERLRLRAERSARANFYRPASRDRL